MTELKDSLKYFLVFIGIIKHYKTILAIKTVVQLKDNLQQVIQLYVIFPLSKTDISL